MMVTISDLNFTYSRRKRLFDKLSLNLSHGHIYGLLGKNGTGKSTLLHLLSGVLFPLKGTIEVFGSVPEKREVPFLQDLFLIPEEFSVPDVTPTKYADLYAQFYPRFDENQYDLYLREFEIVSGDSMSKMSMGQRKKAFIAFALACNTRVLLMDEPTNGLDIPSKTQFRKIIASVPTDERCIVISTHQVRDLENLIDTVVILEDHRIVFNESIDEIAAKVRFISYNDSDKPGDILYDEPGVVGGKAIVPNENEPPSKVDMEILFNAVTSTNKDVNPVFTIKN
ncbi:MAG: ABC transporter ATP-binding protein [Dysgonamonadaceae bacterium]|jgi:ABC-2 type transport system ATP-binding protein|nr:ABC transporter ATP-binding protein [Dysgonamonadaceae bacterium]